MSAEKLSILKNKPEHSVTRMSQLSKLQKTGKKMTVGL